jgi:phosphomevalonate kinase
LIVSAPGKLILAGEYAVLRGGIAVVAAVRRRALARLVPHDPAHVLSPFLDAAARVLESADAPDAAALLRGSIEVDTSALRDGPTKLGLGSSAAATVAGIGCALAASGRPLRRDLVLTLARNAHALAQGARGVPGSGADILASTEGGVLWMRDRQHGPLTLPAVQWLPLWTGHAADTVSLVAAVERARVARPLGVDVVVDGIAAAAQQLTEATDEAGVIAAIAAGAEGIARLSAVVGVDLETERVRAARVVAHRAGGEVKTCGAGGGDVAIAVLPSGCELADLAPAFLEAGCRPLDLPFDPRGVDIDSPGE